MHTWKELKDIIYSVDVDNNPIYSKLEIDALVSNKTLHKGRRNVVVTRPMWGHLISYYEMLREQKNSVSVRSLVLELFRCYHEELQDYSYDRVFKIVWRWTQRMNLVKRRVTRVSQLTLCDTVIMRDFVQYCNEQVTLLNCSPSCVANLDETNVHFDMKGSYTLEKKGAKTVGIRTSGSSQRCTVVLGCFQDGTKLPPYIVFKGKEGVGSQESFLLQRTPWECMPRGLR